MIEEANGVLGTNWKAEDILKYGGDILKIERAFNEAAGIGKEADRMPEFMLTEPFHRTTRSLMYRILHFNSVYRRTVTICSSIKNQGCYLAGAAMFSYLAN